MSIPHVPLMKCTPENMNGSQHHPGNNVKHIAWMVSLFAGFAFLVGFAFLHGPEEPGATERPAASAVQHSEDIASWTQSSQRLATDLVIRQDAEGSSLFILRAGGEDTLVTVQAKPDHRPFLHPINAPDGQGVFTEYSPGHHPHQTGLYWGFTRVNGRDYFHHPEGTYWRRVSVDVLTEQGEQVQLENHLRFAR